MLNDNHCGNIKHIVWILTQYQSPKPYQINTSNTHPIPAIKHSTKSYQIHTSNTPPIPAIKHSTKPYQIHTSNTRQKTLNETLPNTHVQYSSNTLHMEERQVILFPVLFFTYFFPVLFSPYFYFPYLSPRTFSKVETFEIQRFKILVSCFSNTCNYSTVHVPCGIAIETSPVGVPLDGWGARMGDLKGPKINLFNLKEDWNVLYHQPIISLEN